MHLFRGAIGLDFLFMDNNASALPASAVEELLESEDIHCMNSPAKSPDLNHIKHICGFSLETLSIM